MLAFKDFFILAFIEFVFCVETSILRSCPIHDKECLNISTRQFLEQTRYGIPEYTIWPIDPLVIQSLDIVERDGMVYSLKNITVTGLKNQQIADFQMDIKTNSVLLKTTSDVRILGEISIGMQKQSQSMAKLFSAKTKYIPTKTQEEVTPIKIKMMRQRSYNAFKIFVNISSPQTLLGAIFWPDRISFRRFVYKGDNKHAAKMAMIDGLQTYRMDSVTGAVKYGFELKKDNEGVVHFEIGPETFICDSIVEPKVTLYYPVSADALLKDANTYEIWWEQNPSLHQRIICKIVERCYADIVHNIRAAAKVFPATAFFEDIDRYY